MKPFSPLYFIRQNPAKSILLIFMLFLGYGAYLGGLYVTGPLDGFELSFDYYDRFAAFFSMSAKEEEWESIKKDAAEIEGVQLLQLGSYQSFSWNTIMGFDTGDASFTFRSAEDFKAYCEYLGIECDCGDLSEGSLVMSEKFAKNRQLELGDRIEGEMAEFLQGTYTLKAVTDEDGYMQYFITDEADTSPYFILIGKNGKEGRELYDIVRRLAEKHDIFINDEYREEICSQFDTFYKIYMFIIILTSVILAVTINTAFVGMYQRRDAEFAVYRAIGIPAKRIVLKIIGELLCMDIIALTLGGGVFFFALYLFNNLTLYPDGLYLRYFHPMALYGALLCNLLVLLPLFVTRCRQMLKADICEY